ncbi:unnamed protein product [Penicillium bialowiezense]
MSNSTQNKEPTEQPKPKPQVLEEDDEFEDFPIEGTKRICKLAQTSKLTTRPDWPQEEAEQTTGSAANDGSEHLWEESWDDDDAAEDFSKQLQDELKKVEASA